VIDASLGNFDFKLSDTAAGEEYQTDELRFKSGLYTAWIIVGVVIFNMVMLNLIIAILANTYNIFD